MPGFVRNGRGLKSEWHLESTHREKVLTMARRLNAYDRAILEFGERLLLLGGHVGDRLAKAMRSLTDQDGDLAKNVIESDDEIDFLDEKLEMEALELISLQQPTDIDLRYLIAITRISRDLERIADYACDLAEVALVLKDKGPYFKPLVDVPRMGRMALEMLAVSLKAHAERDLGTARRMHDEDRAIDELFQGLLAELTEYMKKGPDYVDQASNLLLAARYLERVGDHAVNIAEMTIFAVTGERHPFKTRKPGV